MMSIDDIDINRVLDSDTCSDLSDYDMDAQGGDDHVILASCGILTVDSNQILEMLATSVDIPGWREMVDDGEVKMTAVTNLDSVHQRSMLDRSMKYRSMSIDVGDEKEMKKSWQKSPAKEVGRQDLVNFLAAANTAVVMKPTKSPVGEGAVRLDYINGMSEPETLVDISRKDEDTASDDLGEISVGLAPDDIKIDDLTSPPVTWECDLDTNVEKTVAEESWVNVNIKGNDGHGHGQGQVPGHIDGQGDEKANNMPLYHPCMKMSFSEGSIASTYHAEVEEMNIDLDELELECLTNVSPLSRLKVKMSSIALPNMPSVQSKRRQAQRVARHNRLKSQLRFQECQTKIILL
jgi:hypothetical protein